MGKKMEIDQFAELSAAVTQSLPRDLNTDAAQYWIRNRAALAVALRKVLAAILVVEKRFDPVRFLGEGWSIWRGPADGDGLSGAEDQDERSLAIFWLDPSKIQLVTMLKDDDERVRGKEILRRLRDSGHIRLDAAVFLALSENPHLIPESWKRKVVYFDGTVLRGPDGDRYALFLYWNVSRWCRSYDLLVHHRDAGCPSAVIDAE